MMSLESQIAELKEFAAKEKLEIALSAPVPVNQSGRQGEMGKKKGGIPSAKPKEFRSNIFKQTPQ